MSVEIFADVKEDGTLSKFKRLEAHQAIKSFAGKRISIKIERAYNRRSNPQNAYFHGVVIHLVKNRLLELGFNEARSDEWVKDFIKYNCLLTECVSETTGEVVKSLGRTSGLSKVQFMELISTIQQWAAEKMDLYIPDPNQQTTLQL